jgi:hypothetical protein
MPLLYKVRDKRRFLAAALAELAGIAQVPFEGDLGGTSLFDVDGAPAMKPRFRRETRCGRSRTLLFFRWKWRW